MSEDFPLVTVVIPAYNASCTVSRAIEAVLNQNYPPQKLEVIVVDDGSTDDTIKVIRNYNVKLVSNEANKGDSASRNIGAKAASGEIIATTDADDIVDQDWLLNLVRGFTKENIGAVVGSSHITYEDSNWQQRIIWELISCTFGDCKGLEIYGQDGKLSDRKVMAVGSNQSFKKSVFETIGGFDEELPAGMDQEILWKVEDANYDVTIQPSAMVYIKAEGTFMNFLKKKRYHIGHVLMHLKHPSKITPTFLFLLGYLPIQFATFTTAFLIKTDILFSLFLFILFLPLFFYVEKLINGRKFIKKPWDIFFLLTLAYVGFMTSSYYSLKGLLVYVLKYRRSL